MASRRDRALARNLSDWFGESRRELPWRQPLGVPGGPRRDPYLCLVAEAMLQQTQVARVVDRLDEFLARFPTASALAGASEDDVLAAWSGLGYYRRAQNLQRAARAIVQEHGGRIPGDPELLGRLPGVGKYTAGALASMVFGHRVPTVDANIERVLLRLEGRDADETPAARSRWCWERAGELVNAAGDAGVHNEALMELGALVCTPRRPRCNACPLSRSCRARRDGRTDSIPVRAPRARRTDVFHTVARVRDAKGKLLVEQRPPDGAGLWRGLWQAPAIERGTRHASGSELSRAVGVSELVECESFVHLTTHRAVRFRVFEGVAGRGTEPARGQFRTARSIAGLGLATPHRRILLDS